VTAVQLSLFEIARVQRRYHDAITALVNAKGCMDVDTVKGCTMGMREPGGCYGECYAATIASRYGIAFQLSVSRGFVDQWQHRDILVRQLRQHPLSWYRIGVMGDPSHDWDHTLRVIRHLRLAEKTAVIVTKHWAVLSDDQLSKMLDLDVVVHTSTSGLDTEAQTRHRRVMRLWAIDVGAGGETPAGLSAIPRADHRHAAPGEWAEPAGAQWRSAHCEAPGGRRGRDASLAQ